MTATPEPDSSSAIDITAPAVPDEETNLRRFISDFTDNKVAVGALFVFLVIIFVAIFCPFISPQDPYDLAVIDILDTVRGSGSGAPITPPYPPGGRALSHYGLFPGDPNNSPYQAVK